MLQSASLDGITWLTGQAVDSLLDSCGALAAAANSHTVLVSSRLAALPLAQRRMILAHELVQTGQLSQPRNDSVRSLEEEAWEAAEAMLSGKVVCIRG